MKKGYEMYIVTMYMYTVTIQCTSTAIPVEMHICVYRIWEACDPSKPERTTLGRKTSRGRPMLPLFKGVVRGFRRITAHIVPPSNCPICLDQLPVIGLAEAAEGAKQETHAKLACRHRFCTECVAPYVEMKLRAREVEDGAYTRDRTTWRACVLTLLGTVDQLVCPVVECKRSLTDRDMKLIGGDELLVRYKTTLKRVRVRTATYRNANGLGGTESLCLCLCLSVVRRMRRTPWRDGVRVRNAESSYCARPSATSHALRARPSAASIAVAPPIYLPFSAVPK
jgi:hypothetical protein